MRVIVTRVQPQAARWVKSLSDKFDAVALPLIVVGPSSDPAPVRAAGQSWTEYGAAMFVSSHAVNYFFEQNPHLALIYQGRAATQTRAWATGPGTRLALLAQGVPEAFVDSPPPDAGQFDSEALWQVVRGQMHPRVRVLIVRGDSAGGDEKEAGEGAVHSAGVGRDWLAQRLQHAGAEVDFVVAYQRGAPVWTPQEQALASVAAVDGSVWLFSSSEALTHLHTLLPAQDWSAARALATHARIAQAATEMGFGKIALARPALPDVIASIESLA